MDTGDILTAPVETLAYGGDGLARVGGRVVFIPETAPGDTVRFRVAEVKKNFARAVALELLEASPARAEPCCRVPDPDTGVPARVPGCVYDHLDYAAEVAAKQRQLEGFIRRLPGCADTPFDAPFASPAPLHYRNKITLHLQQGRLGYRQEPSHRVLDLPACPLACGEINALLSRLREPDALRALPDDADVVLRHTPHDGAVWFPAVSRLPSAVSGNFLPVASCSLPVPCYLLHLTFDSLAGPLLVPRDGFYQVNPSVGEALAHAVQTWFAGLPGTPELLDLYCGVGVFGLACLRAGGARLTGVESGRAAVAAARRNAEALGLRAEFRCAALGREGFDPRGLLREPARAACIVDPPREGLAPAVAAALAASGIRRLLYVSCDPATLARDLAVLLRGGYRVERVRLFDMFPRTAHFETMAELLLPVT
jgi:23S rRNA (uracil1939-C5)-methyltransferase